MARNNYKFAKRQRDLAKKKKKDEKAGTKKLTKDDGQAVTDEAPLEGDAAVPNDPVG